jgi:adenylyltransferase/sulfurtransferase
LAEYDQRLDVPLADLLANPARYLPENNKTETYILCRLGNDSQIAAEALRELGRTSDFGNLVVKDMIGGLRAWATEVDADFPVY